MKRGSIALARELCVQIAGYTDDDQDQCGHDYGSVDIAEILSAEVERLREALAQPEQQAEPVAWMFQHDKTGRMNYVSNDGMHTPELFLKANPQYALVCPLYTTSPQQQAETPPEWPLVKNILDEYGLDAIAFVAEWKAAQRPWVGLTDEDWEKVANRKNTVLDTFEQGAVWAAYKLERRNT